MALNDTLQPWDEGYWEWRAKNPPLGRPKTFTPKKLWAVACEYFDRTRKNPFKKQDFIKGGESAGRIIELDQMRPYTWQGFEDYLNEQGIIARVDDYKLNRDGRYEDFVDVIRAIDRIMYANKFEGAASGIFNANIISRDLGLADKSQVTVKEEQPLFGDEPDNDERED